MLVELIVFRLIGVITLVLLMSKWIGLFLRRKKIKIMSFSLKLDRGSYIISFAKTASKKLGALIGSVIFLCPEFALYLYKLYIYTIVISGLVFLAATWKC